MNLYKLVIESGKKWKIEFTRGEDIFPIDDREDWSSIKNPISTIKLLHVTDYSGRVIIQKRYQTQWISKG